jgi:maltokinase
VSDILTHLDPQVLADYLVRTRWFGGKGRPFSVTGVRRLGTLGADRQVDVLLVELRYADGAGGSDTEVELYQVPLSYYIEPEHRIDHAFVGWWEDPERGWVHAYDALHDREATRLWLTAFGEPGSVGGLEFRRVPGHDLDLDAVGSLFTGEQSNSSVAFGEDSVLKLFRKITPGANPDITTHEVLTRVGSEHVASLYGWIEQAAGDETLHLGMLQQFLRTATDGWELALASIRNLFVDPELAARDAGGDFSGEAARLGEALREVHDLLAREIAVSPALVPTPAAIAGAMNARLDAALLVVPGLDAHAERLRAAYAALADLSEVPVQQVHGDLHLGQTLRTSLGWKIVDFEGEPAKPLADRLLPDSPWRDVAGMLRSFDYAPHVVLRDQFEPEDDHERAELRARGEEWAERNQRYFLQAYAGGDLTTEQGLLVHAYLADKAVYEAVYETRNRPSWVEIPLAGLAKIGT